MAGRISRRTANASICRRYRECGGLQVRLKPDPRTTGSGGPQFRDRIAGMGLPRFRSAPRRRRSIAIGSICSSASAKPPSCSSTPTDSAILPLRGTRRSSWHLAQAAIAGRDIYYDQRYAAQPGDARRARSDPHARDGRRRVYTLSELQQYTKLFWLNTGPYNNLTARKFVLTCSPARTCRRRTCGGTRQRDDLVEPGETLDRLAPASAADVLRSRTVDPTRYEQGRHRPATDILTASTNNLYDGVSLADLESVREQHPLNSRLVKTDGRLDRGYLPVARYAAAVLIEVDRAPPRGRRSRSRPRRCPLRCAR